MQIVLSLFQGAQPGLILPNHPIGWLGWLVMAILLVWGVRRSWEGQEWLRQRWWLAIALAVAAPLVVTTLGVRLPGEVLPQPELPMEVSAPVLMFFAALPWVLAGGLLGPLPSAVIGVLCGLILGLFETHSPFTMLEIGLLGLLYSLAVRQNYRTGLYRYLRHPLGAASLVIAAYIPILIFSTLFSTNDTLAVRFDYALTQIWLPWAARSGEILLASLVAQVIYLIRPEAWWPKRPLVPSPADRNIQVRFLYGIVPLVALLVLTLVVGDWLVAGRVAERMIREQLQSTAEVAADSLPYFLETGQNLILTLADPELLEIPPAEQDDALSGRLRSVPYFRQLFLFDGDGEPVTGYPVETVEEMVLTRDETTGIELALTGVTTQVYVVPPMLGETSAQISFMAAIRGSASDEVLGVLIGRTDLNTNPFTQPVISALASMRELGGDGMILNEKGTILYHPITTEVMRPYLGQRPADAAFFDETSPNNTRQYVQYQPVEGRPWAIVLTVPARLAQQMALDIAVPLLVVLLIFCVLMFVFLRISLRSVTASLRLLAQEAAYIALGQLDRSLPPHGADEVGQLGASFDQMRISLKARLEELNSLLVVSQGVAANLDIREAARPILNAALLDEASAARLVLERDVTLDASDTAPVAFGAGPAAPLYAALDEQLYEMTQQQDVVNLSNLSRSRRLQTAPGAPAPGALIALAIRNESHHYGALWVAHDKPRNYSEEEIRFLSTLAGEAAMAATSARLYATAEAGRQRLEAVLASTPEPVLVTDQKARLLLLNPAAVQVPGLILSSMEGRPINEVINEPELVNLLVMRLPDRITSREIALASGKVYYASVSPVMADGRPVGRVCILRDITHYKEIEQLKSDFVATVSHDLRSPLTLMRGYATMLQMVGDLNEQQKGYVRKIVTGVENMTRLVNNLLDLGRIEMGIGLQIEKVPLNEISDEVINSLQMQAVQKDIRLVQETGLAGENLVVEADRALIQQAMYNLVENAIKYTSVGGQVKVRIDLRPGSALIEVHDTGIGIAPLDLPHLFEKFYRSGRREAYQQRGTGLGLAIVKSIAERHGGRVWVDSQLGKGSIFSIEIPQEQHQNQKVGGENRAFS